MLQLMIQTLPGAISGSEMLAIINKAYNEIAYWRQLKRRMELWKAGNINEILL